VSNAGWRVQHSQLTLSLWPCRVQCSACSKWRILGFDAIQAVSADTEWTCSQLGCTSCWSLCCTGSGRSQACILLCMLLCRHGGARVSRPRFLRRTLSCATVQSKREVRGTRYVALGLEPDAALFEFGESNAAPPAVPYDAKAVPLNGQQTTEQQQDVSAGCCSAPTAVATQQQCTPPSQAAGLRDIVGLAGLEAKPPRRAQLAAACAPSPGSLCQAVGVAAIASGCGGSGTLPAPGAAAQRPIRQQPPPVAAVGPLHATVAVAAAGWRAACTAAVMHT
jgi:hypothetical protein